MDFISYSASAEYLILLIRYEHIDHEKDLLRQVFFNEIHSFGMSEIFLRNIKYTSCMKYASHIEE